MLYHHKLQGAITFTFISVALTLFSTTASASPVAYLGTEPELMLDSQDDYNSLQPLLKPKSTGDATIAFFPDQEDSLLVGRDLAGPDPKPGFPLESDLTKSDFTEFDLSDLEGPDPNPDVGPDPNHHPSGPDPKPGLPIPVDSLGPDPKPGFPISVDSLGPDPNPDVGPDPNHHPSGPDPKPGLPIPVDSLGPDPKPGFPIPVDSLGPDPKPGLPIPVDSLGPDPKPGLPIPVDSLGPDPKPGLPIPVDSLGPDPKPGLPIPVDSLGPDPNPGNPITSFLEDGDVSSSDDNSFVLEAWDGGNYDERLWMDWKQEFVTDLLAVCPPKSQRVNLTYDRLSGDRFQYKIPTDMQNESGPNLILVGFYAEEGVFMDDVLTALKRVLVLSIGYSTSKNSRKQTRGNLPYMGTQYYSMKGIGTTPYAPSDSSNPTSKFYPQFSMQITAVRHRKGERYPPARPIPEIEEGMRLTRRPGCSGFLDDEEDSIYQTSGREELSLE
ncbi:MAG: hypothetical protein M1837_003922 [Sclerophora amabilis]|nr:MAG: hypothetical protein M1837_003922 [Sclerophora amabilis]